jgi:hypothetical protein
MAVKANRAESDLERLIIFDNYTDKHDFISTLEFISSQMMKLDETL